MRTQQTQVSGAGNQSPDQKGRTKNIAGLWPVPYALVLILVALPLSPKREPTFPHTRYKKIRRPRHSRKYVER
jgi:hypothetical protein